MDLSSWTRIPSWEWPPEVGTEVLRALEDTQRDPAERLVAANLAGQIAMDEPELFRVLSAIVADRGETDALRARSAIALGPGLEMADEDLDFDPDDSPISLEIVAEAQRRLRSEFLDAGNSKEVRRRILEGSVRNPQDWHLQAITEAWESGDPEWKLTAVFCMQYCRGFSEQILAALEDDDEEVLYQAVAAAGNWELRKAWPRIEAILTSERPDKDLLLAAIEAAVFVHPNKAAPLLVELMDHRDEDVVDAVHESLAFAGLDL